jgi:hypothetical protein
LRTAFPRGLLIAVALFGLLLVSTAIPAPFTIDENNYLVTVLGLRQGRLTVPGTEGLPPSRELLYFDPAAIMRSVSETPVVSTAPPLYAVLAAPFSFLGWRGLVALNTIALLAVILLVFALTRRCSSAPEAPWIAAFCVGLGAYFYEYAQGLWPHMVAVALVTGAAYCATRALTERPARWASAAGLLSAAAAGVRYQNAFVVACLGFGLFALSRRRFVAAAAFGLGALPPLGASSLINHARIGSWNPVSKGPGYLPNSESIAAGGEGSFLGDFVTMAWARIVDYTAAPSLAGTIHESFHTPHPVSGAYVMVTAVKKAWLQSAPWMVVPLLLLAGAWLPARWWQRAMGSAPQPQLRLLSLVVLPTLAMFSATGPARTDGLCFNQRYFCELVPLVAVAFAWAVEGIARRRTVLLVGGLLGATLGFVSLMPHHLVPLRHYLLLYVPLALAALLAGAWLVELRRRWSPSRSPAAPAALSLLAGATLAWAAVAHIGDDVTASRIMRQSRQGYLRELRPYLADRSAVFASGAIKDALGPLALELDVVIAVPAYDQAQTTEALLDTFLAQGRRVFLLPNVLPRELFDQILAGRRVRSFGQPLVLIEVARE